MPSNSLSIRSAAQIKRAKARAVGGRKKKCVKGKSCSATCIAANKVCLVDLPDPVDSALSQVRDELSAKPSKKGPSVFFEGTQLVVNGERFQPGKTLPGSTNPTLYTDSSGKGKWVVKEGGAPGQNKAEKAANDVYQILSGKLGSGGVESRLVDGKLVNRFVENGRTLNSLGASEIRRLNIADRIRKSHMADALVASWDYIGLVNDNMMVDRKGNLIRIDSGGTFNFRAMGGDKKFGAIPMEIWSLREGQGKQFWSGASDRDFRNLWVSQARALSDSSRALRSSVGGSGLSKDVRDSFNRRLEAIEIARQTITSVPFKDSTISSMADKGQISWRDVDRALERAFTRASSVDSNSSGWNAAVKREVEAELGRLI